MLFGKPPVPTPVKELLVPVARLVVRIVSDWLHPWVKSANSPTPVRVVVFSSKPPRPAKPRPASAADVSNCAENVLAGMFDVKIGHLPVLGSRYRNAPLASTWLVAASTALPPLGGVHAAPSVPPETGLSTWYDANWPAARSASPTRPTPPPQTPQPVVWNVCSGAVLVAAVALIA